MARLALQVDLDQRDRSLVVDYSQNLSAEEERFS
jgi:hypothetical protein